MAIEDRVECWACGRAVVPQLWVTDRGELTVPKVRHLCPACGETLRVTGGGLTRGGLFFLVGLLVITLVVGFLLLFWSGSPPIP